MPACSAGRGAKIQYLKGFATRCVIGKPGNHIAAQGFLFATETRNKVISLNLRASVATQSRRLPA